MSFAIVCVLHDSREDALTYLRSLSHGLISDELAEALVDGTPQVLEFLETKTPLRFQLLPIPDYHSERPGSGSVDHYNQDNKTYAIFTNETLHVTDKFDINVGLRYTDDEKSLDATSTNIGGGAGCAAANQAFNIIAGVVSPAILQQLASDHQLRSVEREFGHEITENLVLGIVGRWPQFR